MSTQSVLFDAPGPKARARHLALTAVGVVLLAAIIWVVLSKLDSAGQLDPSLWTVFLQSDAWSSYLIPGLVGTLEAAALSVVFAAIFGIVFGMGRLSSITPLRWVCGVIVEFFRAVPVLMMMVFAYFGFFSRGAVSSDMAPLASVVTALTLYNGSVIAELLRAGVFGLPKGQLEAGLAIGLTPSQTLRTIQLPQAITAMLPALVSQLVVVLKDTALGYAITYPELLNWAKTLGSAYGNTVPAYLVTALMFLVINYALTSVARLLERRLKRRAAVTIGADALVQGAAEPGRPAAHGTLAAEGALHRNQTVGDADGE